MKTICLTLDKRVDYCYDYIQPEFKKRFNIDVEMFLAGKGGKSYIYDHIDTDFLPPTLVGSINYPTWHERPNAYNAWKCHREIFLRFIRTKEEYLLLLEDDVFIEDDAEEIIGDDLENLIKTYNADMVYLGSYNATKHGRLEAPNILSLPRLSGVGGFHAVIMNRNIVRELLDFGKTGPFDWQAAKSIHGNGFRCLAVTPSVITQRDGFSYVEGHELKKPDRSI